MKSFRKCRMQRQYTLTSTKTKTALVLDKSKRTNASRNHVSAFNVKSMQRRTPNSWIKIGRLKRGKTEQTKNEKIFSTRNRSDCRKASMLSTLRRACLHNRIVCFLHSTRIVSNRIIKKVHSKKSMTWLVSYYDIPDRQRLADKKSNEHQSGRNSNCTYAAILQGSFISIIPWVGSLQKSAGIWWHKMILYH